MKTLNGKMYAYYYYYRASARLRYALFMLEKITAAAFERGNAVFFIRKEECKHEDL